MTTLPKRHGPIKSEVVCNIGIEVIFPLKILSNLRDASQGKV